MTLLGHLRAAAARFHPTLWPTLITVPTLILLVGLGVWQLERLEWKEALIAERQSRSSQPAIALPADLDDAARLQYLPVRVRGRFRHDRELYLAARTFEGQVGLHVVTPLVLADGRMLLVDRGWIPDGRRDPATRPEGQVAGEIELTGLVRLPGWAGMSWLKPDNQPAENLWFWIDPAAMAAAAGLDGVIPEIYLDAGPAENPGGWPKGGQTRIDLPNDHLQYAITWFTLALSLAVIYVVYHLRCDTDEEAP
jgi:surfeit locus 1 family protein